MKVIVPSGTYVLAVSGGVDSMVLLDILAKQAKNLELVVAHFNHGIRPDSYSDEQLVAEAAMNYGLKFEAGRGELGSKVSEEQARKARYEFLEKIRDKYRADGIITAHHQDDLIETAVINILRGTGPRGLVAISQNKKVLRPLLSVPKKEIIGYAKKNSIKWREDPTNLDERYLRNYVRRRLMTKLDGESRQRLLENIENISKTGTETGRLVVGISKDVKKDDKIDRGKFISLPFEVGSELLAGWLRNMGVGEFDRRTIARLNLALRTGKPGTVHDVMRGLRLKLTGKYGIIELN